MESINFHLETVQERFPEYKDRAVELYDTDSEFRAICEEYYLCIRYLNKFRKESSEKKEFVGDYESIRKDLEKELLEAIEKPK